MTATMPIDQYTIAKLTRLRILRSKQGMPFNLMEFVRDRDIARGILHDCMSASDEETITIALSLTRQFGIQDENASVEPSKLS